MSYPGLTVNSRWLLMYVVGIEPPDAQREREGVVALQQLELKVDHSVSAMASILLCVYILDSRLMHCV